MFQYYSLKSEKGGGGGGYSYFQTLLVESVCHIVYRSAAQSLFLDMFFPSVFSFSSNFVQIKNCQNIREAETFDRQSGR